MSTLTLTINKQRYELHDLDPRTTLLDVCRHHLNLTGAKKGCDHGQCGACTMLINGRRINGCLTLAVMHDGDEITTIEGVGMPDNLSALQEAFAKHDAFQCGYCTPGQICSATALIEEVKNQWPSHVSADLQAPDVLQIQEIAERMSGNICRCSAYPNIIKAIKEVLDGDLSEANASTDNHANNNKKGAVSGIWSPPASDVQTPSKTNTDSLAQAKAQVQGVDA
ncbi:MULTISPECIES: 2Fe-2S iron-sulfur cluster-binding protein [unclassified Psychrobacter]|uniref:2Fe-2S iron-sulfur cluster-binding protein n=1 Tax=unclassified Psychrobacter TaxID=196806 RepID=UPI0018F29311|nr:MULTISPECIES: 2Fe-2S iron-sulfur cluster-binding protein [unclassified Psychrobacter]